MSRLFLSVMCAAVLAVTRVAFAADDKLTDDQRAAMKRNTDPVVSATLRLGDGDMTWWRDAKLGMFIHWGLYAIPAEGEWYMHNRNIPAETYAKLADQFKGEQFDAAKWAAAAKDAGMKYMVMVTRHHDGFAMWDSPSSYQNFTSFKTAAHRDFVREYTDAARRAGLRVGLYYSPVDWRFPGYFHPQDMPENAQLLRRQTYDQIRELMTHYGKIDVLWYDGGWLALKGTDSDAAWFWDPIKLNTMVRELQPKVVINPRSGWEGDFQCEEGPREITGPIRTQVWEKCLTIEQSSWGYNKHENLMPLAQLITHLVNAVCRNGNALFNVGPDATGVIPPHAMARLKELGDWMTANGSSIYGTRPGPFQPVDRVYGSTFKGSTLYVHVLSWPADTLKLPPLSRKILSAKCIDGKAATFTQDAQGITLAVPASYRQTVDTIVQLEVDGLAK